MGVLNKFFCTTKEAIPYDSLYNELKEKYCGSWVYWETEYPSFYQFRYFYRKTRKMQNFIISRDELKRIIRGNNTAYR